MEKILGRFRQELTKIRTGRASLSILDELRFLHGRHPDVPAHDLLKMGTLRGAAALGWSKEVGSLTMGKAADLVVLPLETSVAVAGWESVLESTQTPIAVYIDGVQNLKGI